MTRRTVAFLTVTSPPGPPQGVAAYSEALTGALGSSEFDILIWSQRNGQAGGAPKNIGGAMPVWQPGLWAGSDLLRRLRRTRPDILHVQFEFGLYGGVLGLASVLSALVLAQVVLRQRIVVTLHQVPSTHDLTVEWLRWFGVRLPAWAARRAVALTVAILGRSSDQLIVHADVFRDRLQAEWGVRDAPAVVPHGIALNGHPRSHGEHRLLLFGYVKRYKGIEIAIEAFRRLAEEFPDWTLTIAGPSPSEAYLESLQSLARPLGSRVEFLGRVDEEDVAELFRRAGIVLLPYRTLFSASGPLAQAMGHMTPFVISDELRPLSPSWPHWAPLDPEEWARALRSLMRDEEARATAGRLAATHARGLSWSAAADRTREIYRAVVS